MLDRDGLQNSSLSNTRFLVLNAQFLVLITEFLVLNPQFVMLLTRTSPRVLRAARTPVGEMDTPTTGPDLKPGRE